jgi:hypothetical protein
MRTGSKDMRNVFKISVGNPEEKNRLENLGEDGIIK